MQAMAPGAHFEPQAGHCVGSEAGAGAAAADLEAPLPDGAAAGAPAATATAAAGWGAAAPAAAGTANSCLQLLFGQRTFLPAALSGTCIAVRQCGQVITFGMVLSLCHWSLVNRHLSRAANRAYACPGACPTDCTGHECPMTNDHY